MEQKVVKLEIGKLLAIIIAVAVIAVVATTLIKSSYFEGMLIAPVTQEQYVVPADDLTDPSLINIDSRIEQYVPADDLTDPSIPRL